MSKDWFAWHDNYRTRPRMRQRLQIVREYISTSINECPPGKITVISVCAGDSRDLIGTLFNHPRASDVYGRLVEIDSRLVEGGRSAAASAGLDEQLEFICGDATLSSVYQGFVPADLVLLCGVFGNVPETELPRLIQSLQYLCRTNGLMIWTRDLVTDGEHRLATIRERLQEAAFEEVSFKMTPTGNMGVGMHRYLGEGLPLPDDEELFLFSSPLDTQDAWPFH
ncbi:MAG TPA: class I SAM-dependent methyltransferase [Candidatus Sericytochromatia bacterium]